jgi:hypothetical protein
MLCGAGTFYVDERTVDVPIGRLRKMLNAGRDTDPIRAVRGAGYALDDRLVKPPEKASQNKQAPESMAVFTAPPNGAGDRSRLILPAWRDGDGDRLRVDRRSASDARNRAGWSVLFRRRSKIPSWRDRRSASDR